MGIGIMDYIDKLIVKKYSKIKTVNCGDNNQIECSCNEGECCNCSGDNSEYDSSEEYWDFDMPQNKEKLKEKFWELQDKYQEMKLANEVTEDIQKIRKDMQELVNPNRMYERLGVDILSLRVGMGLLQMADPDKRGPLLPELAAVRMAITDEFGFIIPNVRVMDVTNLGEFEYAIFVRGNMVFKGVVSEEEVNANNTDTIIYNLRETILKYAHQIMSKTDVLKLMELVRSQDPTLINDLVPIFLSPMDLKNIFTNLIQEKISIKDIIYVFEILNDHARYTQNTDELTEIVKKELLFYKK